MKTFEGGVIMRKFTENEVYNVFSSIYSFMESNRDLCKYALYEDGYLLATDGFKLIRKKFPISDDNEFSITKDDIKLILKKTGKKRKKEYIEITEDDMYLYIGNAMIMKKARNFPDWKAVYPNFTYTNEVNFSKSEVVNIMKELSQLRKGDLKKYSSLHIKLQKDYMQLSLIDLTPYTPLPVAQKQVGSVKTTLDKDVINFCVDFDYYATCIKACNEVITMKYHDNEHPIIITDNKDTEILLMGMKYCIEI